MTNLLLMAYDLNAPMTFKQFDRMPDEYRRAYLDGLIGRFGASDAMIGEMMGVTSMTVYQWRRRLGVDGCGMGRGRAERTAWNKWRENRESRIERLADEVEAEHPEVTVL